ncbi:MAG: DUF4476 domain-containing protein [Bacteroidetes bacterium]|nr:DUF4476 domain-containing protein [Bacteroidota bacterium]
MKKLIFLLLLLSPVFIIAQPFGSLNIFSENGDKFYVYLDGKKQNEIARSNIRIEKLPDLFYAAKIVFEDHSIPTISKNNLYVSDENDVPGDATYKIRKDKDGKAKLNFYSMNAVQQQYRRGADVFIFQYDNPEHFETLQAVPKEAPVSPGSNSKTLGSLNVFSQNGDKFFLYLDGIKQNETAQSNVRISNIPGLYYTVKIVFNDSKLPTIVKNNVVVSDAEEQLVDAAYRIRRDQSAKPRFNFYAIGPAKTDFTPPPGMSVFTFSTPGEVKNTRDTAAMAKQPVAKVKGSISNLKVTEAPAPKATGTPAATTAKSSKTKEVKPETGKSDNGASANTKATAKSQADAPASKSNNNPNAEIKKCNGWPIGKGDLVAGKKIIEQAATEEEKLTVAQDFIISNCLTVHQVAEFCSLFKSEKTRMSFAKYAYKFTIDRNNYAELASLFATEKSRKELNTFINGD